MIPRAERRATYSSAQPSEPAARDLSAEAQRAKAEAGEPANLLRFRVSLPIDLDELRCVHMGVALRGAQSRVAEQLLNRAKVRTALQQVCRKRMPQCVGTDAELGAALRHVPAQKPIDAAPGQPTSSIIHK